METLQQLSAWHWLILAALLFAVETMGGGGFLLGVAAAAIVASLLAWSDVAWQYQLLGFGTLSFVFSVLYWRYFRGFNLARQNDTVINQKLETLIGKTGVILQAKSDNTGKVKLGDTLWECRSETTLNQDDQVVVEGYSGMLLLVKPLQ